MRFMILCVLPILILFSFCGKSISAEDNTGVTPMTEKSMTTKGVICSFSIPVEGMVKQPLLMTITIENSAPAAVGFSVAEIPYCSAVLIDRATRRKCALTRKGVILLGDETLKVRSAMYVSLKQGEKKSFHVDLNKCYELPAGEYELSLTLKHPVEAKIDNVVFTIK